MAAFIQKLFGKNKSAGKSGATRGNTKPAPVKPVETPAVDPRDELHATQQQQLANAPTDTQLEQLAIEGLTADIRAEAAGRLTDKAGLQRIQKEAKGRDKGVYQIVRQALQHLREEEELAQKIRDRIQALVTSATEQARSEDMKLYEARLDALLKQWAEVEKQATADQINAFLEAIHQCRERVNALKAEAEDLQRQREQQQQRAETLALLQTTLDELRQQSPDQAPAISSLDALQKTQENRWLEATRDTTVDKQQQKHYESLMQPLKLFIAALRRLGQYREQLAAFDTAQATDDSGDAQTRARELIKAIDWPMDFARPEQLDALTRKAGETPAAKPPKRDDAEQKQQADALKSTMAKLDEALDAKQLKESKQLFKQAQQQLKALDHRHSKPFQARIQLLGGQLRELTDWQGFATEPKQIALCEQMEYLATQPMEPEAKSERIRELQNEWRELGGSSDRTLWTRFKAASDTAYEPCKAYFAAKSGLKQANLETRKAICDQLATFVDNADWSRIDWKSAERIHQTARQEWKAAWPIEFRDNRTVQKRFDELLKQLEEPLEAERRKNEALKQDIVDRAHALITHEPLNEAMDRAKGLQTEWKQIGITRHREDRKLWQSLRQACDEIFARRDAQKSEQQQASRDADASAAPVLTECEALQQATDPQAVEQVLSGVRAITAEPVSPAVRERLNQEKRRLTQLLDNLKIRSRVQTWQNLVSARMTGALDQGALPETWTQLASDGDVMAADELVIRAEILTGTASPESDQGRRMQIQVQRLADGMGNSNGDTPDTGRQLEALVAHWCLRLPAEAVNNSLAERLNRSLETMLE
jgi:exonuclease SbcC